jgi:NAD(P)H-dependent FMN reductase
LKPDTLPGSLKNAIDWLVESGQLYRKAVAWINVGAPGRGAGAEATLATVLKYVDADVIERACVRADSDRTGHGRRGRDRPRPRHHARLAAQLASVAEHVRVRQEAGT